jgi:tryptophan-rich sensory protein
MKPSWNPLFLGLHWPSLAFAESTLLWLVIAATLVAFRHVSRPAARLLAPCLAWVGFAAVMSFTIWRLNS